MNSHRQIWKKSSSHGSRKIARRPASTRPIILACLLVLMFGEIFAVQAADPLLKGIEFKSISATEERVLFKLNGAYHPEVFGIEGENPRVVCDFPDMRVDDKTVKSLIDTNGKYVRNIRVGLHSTPTLKVRVVLDLTPANDYDIEQMLYKEENLFVIAIHQIKDGPAPEAAAEPEEPEEPEEPAAEIL